MNWRKASTSVRSFPLPNKTASMHFKLIKFGTCYEYKYNANAAMTSNSAK